MHDLEVYDLRNIRCHRVDGTRHERFRTEHWRTHVRTNSKKKRVLWFYVTWICDSQSEFPSFSVYLYRVSLNHRDIELNDSVNLVTVEQWCETKPDWENGTLAERSLRNSTPAHGSACTRNWEFQFIGLHRQSEIIAAKLPVEASIKPSKLYWLWILHGGQFLNLKNRPCKVYT